MVKKTSIKKKYIPNSKEKYMCAKHKKFFTDELLNWKKDIINANNLGNLLKLKSKDQIKFIIDTDDDYSFAKEFIKKNNFRAQLIFQPTWGSSIKLLTEKVLNDNLKVRVLPQLHKDIWGDLKGK